MKVGVIIISFGVMICLPVNAQKIAEIENADWQEIPNTGIPSSLDFGDNVYVDINGIMKDKDVIIFDMVGSDASYGRIKINCLTNSWNELRSGIFLSESKISYQEYDENNNSLNPYENSYQEKIFRFVCNVANQLNQTQNEY